MSQVITRHRLRSTGKLLLALILLGTGFQNVVVAQVIIRGGGKVYDGLGIPVRPYSTFPSLIRCPDGSLLCYDRRSTDSGRTWNRSGKFGFPLGDATHPYRGLTTTLSDGTILIFGRYTQPHERRPDVFVTELFRSGDNFTSYGGPIRAQFHVPHVVPGTDEYGQPANGPFLEQSIVELPNGDLLATMWGWLTQDRAPVDYPDRWARWQLKKSRALLVKSQDRGLNWHYVSTIASDPQVGPEGFRLPTLGLLSDGQLLSVMRNGDGGQPLWSTRSTDGGHTWEPLDRIDVDAGTVSLLVLADGTVLIAFGRPELHTLGSSDGGRTWDIEHRGDLGTQSTAAFTGRVAMIETSPGHVLAVYNDVTELTARLLRVTRQ